MYPQKYPSVPPSTIRESRVVISDTSRRGTRRTSEYLRGEMVGRRAMLRVYGVDRDNARLSTEAVCTRACYPFGQVRSAGKPDQLCKRFCWLPAVRGATPSNLSQRFTVDTWSPSELLHRHSDVAYGLDLFSLASNNSPSDATRCAQHDVPWSCPATILAVTASLDYYA